jgi:imidazolonepropionase
MGMSVGEALFAATSGGAAAQRHGDIGHLAVGAHCDLVILNALHAADVVYRPGSSLVKEVWRAPTE